MKKQTIFYALAFVLMILDSKTAIHAAADGVRLCLEAVIPSLLPFMALSTMLTGLLAHQTFRILKPLCRLFHVPEHCQGILLLSFLGGYPTGAQAITQAAKDGTISQETARRMLAFGSNAGPSFLFGMGAALFPKQWMCWALWAIHIFSSMLVSQCFRTDNIELGRSEPPKPLQFTQAMARSVSIMGLICGWVICFRVVLAFLDRWLLWRFPNWVRCLICGMLELSNGSLALTQLDSMALRFILFSFLLGFGGICVAMQTYAVTEGIDATLYLPGKLLHGIFSAVLASALFSREMLLTSLILITILFLTSKKGIAFGPSMMYNKANRSGRKTPCSFAKRSSPSAPTAPTLPS